MKTGRPTDYTPELANEICNAIASSNTGVRRLCNQNQSFPNSDTVYRWLSIHEGFSDQYARAKQQQIEVIVDEIIEIADDTSQDTLTTNTGKVIADKEHINRSRLRIDTRKWLASKLVPKIYGKSSQQSDLHDDTEMQETMSKLREVSAAYERNI